MVHTFTYVCNTTYSSFGGPSTAPTCQQWLRQNHHQLFAKLYPEDALSSSVDAMSIVADDANDNVKDGKKSASPSSSSSSAVRFAVGTKAGNHKKTLAKVVTVKRVESTKQFINIIDFLKFLLFIYLKNVRYCMMII